jgi:hypothetical protein
MSNLNSRERAGEVDVGREFGDVAREAASLSENVRTELASFPSGAAMLDVHCRGRLFVLAYTPGHGFGVDEVDDGVVGLGTWFRHHYDDIAAAREKLLTLLAECM